MGGKKNGTEEENSSGSHCCLHGEAADLAVAPSTLQNPFSLQLGFDMLKYRERHRENGVFERDSLQTWHQAYSGWMACTLECVDCAALQPGISLRQSWTQKVNDFSCMWDSPLLKLSALMFVFAVGSEVTPIFDFSSLFLSLLQSLFPAFNTLLPLLLSSCVDLSPSPFILCVVVEWLR